jgi:hypothetical protein
MRNPAGPFFKSLTVLVLSVSLLAACGKSSLPLQPQFTPTVNVVEAGVTPSSMVVAPSDNPATLQPTLAATGTPLPQATSTLPVPVVPSGDQPGDPALTLVARDTDIHPDKWSRDGRYLSYTEWGARNEAGSDRTSISLKSLDLRTGEVCAAAQEIMRSTKGSSQEAALPVDFSQRTAWLDDNRLLYLGTNGSLQALTPCKDTSETLTGSIPDRILRIADASPERSQLLLEGEKAYWLYTPAARQALPVAIPAAGSTLEAQPVFSWSTWSTIAYGRVEKDPGGPWVLLDLIDAQTGQVSTIAQIQVEPFIIVSSVRAYWLDMDHVAIQYVAGTLTMAIVDLQNGQVTNIIPTMLGGDTISPESLSISGAIPSPVGQEYHLFLFTGLAPEAYLYLYHGESGRLDKTSLGLPSLLVFPNGESAFLQLFDAGGEPQPSDTYLLIYADALHESNQLHVSSNRPVPVDGLSVELLPGRKQAKVDALQGVFLIDLQNQDNDRSWRMQAPEELDQLYSISSPSGGALVVFAHRLDTDEGSWEMYRLDLTR